MATQYEIIVAAKNQTAAGLKSVERDVGGTLKRLKGQFGEESALGNIGKLLTGAGAVAGITLIGRALSDASAKAVELKDAFNAGTIGAGELADQLARSVPILGQLYTAGRNLRELFTGEQALTNAILAEAAAQDKLTE